MHRKIYLINGIIFQKGYVLGTGLDSEIGIRAAISQAMNYGVFTGIVSPSEKMVPSEKCGDMHDKWGYSEITDFELTENHITFLKSYIHRTDSILYNFEKNENGLWIGRYNGVRSGKGHAKMYFREIAEDFFNPPS